MMTLPTTSNWHCLWHLAMVSIPQGMEWKMILNFGFTSDSWSTEQDLERPGWAAIRYFVLTTLWLRACSSRYSWWSGDQKNRKRKSERRLNKLQIDRTQRNQAQSYIRALPIKPAVSFRKLIPTADAQGTMSHAIQLPFNLTNSNTQPLTSWPKCFPLIPACG